MPGPQMLMEPVTGQFPGQQPMGQPGPLTYPMPDNIPATGPPGPGYVYGAPPGTDGAPTDAPATTLPPAMQAPGQNFMYAVPAGTDPSAGPTYAAPAMGEGAPTTPGVPGMGDPLYGAPGMPGAPTNAPAPLPGQTIMGNTYQVGRKSIPRPYYVAKQ